MNPLIGFSWHAAHKISLNTIENCCGEEDLMEKMREDARKIIQEAINLVRPEPAVKNALNELKQRASLPNSTTGKLLVIAFGKAAWNMAKAAEENLGERIQEGLVITKYGHSKGDITGFRVIEAGHPLPDCNSVRGAEEALKMVENLDEEDMVILLISGGGSALFEKPMEGITLEELSDLTRQLLFSGADIIEMNTVRKHLSSVKGGRFAQHCGKAKIRAVILSDVIGDRLDAIASGPAYPDESTSEEALQVIDKYALKIPRHLRDVLNIETPKKISNCESIITGSVSLFCEAAAGSAEKLGYQPVVLASTLQCEAKEAGRVMAAIAREISCGKSRYQWARRPCALIAGGETTVHVTGKGKGGRNQEMALSAALGIEGLEGIVIFSVSSDGTDGPTDAAGGMVDGKTADRIRTAGFSPEQYLNNNDAYHALKTSGDLIMTGPTGTNVNDIVVILCR
jgi:glycerate 2-kinase